VFSQKNNHFSSKTNQKILDLLIEPNKSGKTLIIVTYDDKATSEMNRIIHLEDGEIV
jgi:ABC-type lipoprotein export system ATPase subunit